MSPLTWGARHATLNQMVNNIITLDHAFSALGDPTRRAMVQRLARGPATVGELARPHRMSAPAISKHVRVLEHAGLLRREKRGREHWCHLQPEALEEAGEWLEQQRAYWESLLDKLDTLLEQQDDQGDLS